MNLTTNADAWLNIDMEVGSVSEQVTVSGEATRVSTESATIQQLVDSKRIVELPLNGRNVYQLARLVPGTGPGGFNIGGGKTGGQNSNMVNARLDGNLNVNTAYGDILPSPSPDAVQEFSMQTSVPSARYGWASGVVEVSTRSGTSALHGSFYEFLRNDKLDARSFFLPTKTKRKRNQYGVAAGGPVWIPKLYDGRNKTFWFVNFEQQKEPLGAPVSPFVPTGPQLRGDYSATARVIRDPLTNQPFAGNIIPQSRLDPLAVNYSKKFVPATTDATGLFRYQRPADNNPTTFLIRADQALENRHQLSARSFLTRRKGPSAAGDLPAFQQSASINETDFVGTTWVWTVSPNKINTARFGFNGTYSNAELNPKLTDSNYHGLQASLDRRFASGLTILASYTFSKSLTDGNTVLTNNGGVPNPDDRRAEWGPADHDRTHAFIASWIYQVPFASSTRGLARAVLHGWELNGIWSAYSGAPLAFVTSQDRSLRGQPNRPDRFRDARLSTSSPRAERISRYFDTTAYAVNRIGEFGSAPRAESQLRAPGSVELTAGIFKRFRGIRESHSVQSRTELFNALNRPNFNGPGTNPDSPASFGRIVGAADGRIIQFGLKYLF